jgi:hypothetical protein
MNILENASNIAKDRSASVKKIIEKYRGLRAEDLEEMNPEYSCVICGNNYCPQCGNKKTACPEHVFVSVEEFVRRYDFE